MENDHYEGQFVIVTMKYGTVRGVMARGKDDAADHVIVANKTEVHILPISEIERIDPIVLL